MILHGTLHCCVVGCCVSCLQKTDKEKPKTDLSFDSLTKAKLHPRYDSRQQRHAVVVPPANFEQNGGSTHASRDRSRDKHSQAADKNSKFHNKKTTVDGGKLETKKNKKEKPVVHKGIFNVC